MELQELTVLYVEDDYAIRKSLALYLQRKVKEVYTAEDGLEGLEIYREKKPDMILTDIEMPELDGIEMAKEIKEQDKNAIIVFLSSHSDEYTLKKSFNSGAESFFSKYDDYEDLFKEMGRLATVCKVRKEDELLQKTVEEILETQDNMIAVVEGSELKIANISFLDFFGFTTVDEYNSNFKGVGKIAINDISNRAAHVERFFQKSLDNVVELVDREKNSNFFNLHISQLSCVNEKSRFLLNLNNITDYEHKTNELYKQATTDSLTGLTNRFKAEEFLDREMLLAKKYHQPISIIYIDIDDFKIVNDTFGHKVGDEILIAISKELSALVEDSDMIVRWGGEEFVIISVGTTKEEACAMAEKLRAEIEKKNFPTARKVTCSFGVNEIEKDESAQSFIDKADKALYFAKRNGKNRVERF